MWRRRYRSHFEVFDNHKLGGVCIVSGCGMRCSWRFRASLWRLSQQPRTSPCSAPLLTSQQALHPYEITIAHSEYPQPQSRPADSWITICDRISLFAGNSGARDRSCASRLVKSRSRWLNKHSVEGYWFQTQTHTSSATQVLDHTD